MPRASEWKRINNFPKDIIKKANEVYPGDSFGSFVAPDGSAAKKTEEGVIKVCDPHSKKWIPVTL